MQSISELGQAQDPFPSLPAASRGSAGLQCTLRHFEIRRAKLLTLVNKDAQRRPAIVMATPVQIEALRASMSSRRRSDTDVGDLVRFPLASIFLPDPEEVLASLSLASVVEGTIVDFSDSGTASRKFAIVEMVQKHKVVVPVATLRLANEPPSGKEQE